MEIQQGFKFDLTVMDIDTINPRLAGESEIDGQDIVWGHALKFTTTTLNEDTDSEGMIKDVEVKLEIEIPCDTKAEVTKINNFLRQWRNDPKPFNCDIYLPKFANKIYKAKTILKGYKFIALFEKE